MRILVTSEVGTETVGADEGNLRTHTEGFYIHPEITVPTTKTTTSERMSEHPTRRWYLRGTSPPKPKSRS